MDYTSEDGEIAGRDIVNDLERYFKGLHWSVMQFYYDTRDIDEQNIPDKKIYEYFSGTEEILKHVELDEALILHHEHMQTMVNSIMHILSDNNKKMNDASTKIRNAQNNSGIQAIISESALKHSANIIKNCDRSICLLKRLNQK